MVAKVLAVQQINLQKKSRQRSGAVSSRKKPVKRFKEILEDMVKKNR